MEKSFKMYVIPINWIYVIKKQDRLQHGTKKSEAKGKSYTRGLPNLICQHKLQNKIFFILYNLFPFEIHNY